VAETGQPYQFTGDDPLNSTDPLGLISRGTICGSHGSRSRACRGARIVERNVAAIHKRVATGRPHAHIIDVAGGIAHLAHKVGSALATHPVATAGLVLGTVALAIPGAEGVGAETDAESLAALTSESDLSPTSLEQTVKAVSGGGAAIADTYECAKGSYASCGGALLGGASLATPGDQADEFFGWLLTGVKYATGG
jgi:hypothetical protein